MNLVTICHFSWHSSLLLLSLLFSVIFISLCLWPSYITVFLCVYRMWLCCYHLVRFDTSLHPISLLYDLVCLWTLYIFFPCVYWTSLIIMFFLLTFISSFYKWLNLIAFYKNAWQSVESLPPMPEATNLAFRGLAAFVRHWRSTWRGSGATGV